MLGGPDLSQSPPSLLWWVSRRHIAAMLPLTSSSSRLSTQRTHTGTKIDVDAFASEFFSNCNSTTMHQVFVPCGANSDLHRIRQVVVDKSRDCQNIYLRRLERRCCGQYCCAWLLAQNLPVSLMFSLPDTQRSILKAELRYSNPQCTTSVTNTPAHKDTSA